ncbi:hypothetical protein HNQ56_002896 [Anaerotaenia torta]|uniref:DUF2812 domain-containing protein n=1 Tax=Anaerotaenia torta TaxID=433293 RepID=UPI003D249A4F
MKKKIIRKHFFLSDFLEEQKFLQKQHRLGWKFVELKGTNKYIFEQAEAEDFIYQMDVIPAIKDEEAYLLMFKDYGWEYVTKYNAWYYFRKIKKCPTEDISIFSDASSKLDMIKRGQNVQTATLLCLCVLSAYWIFSSPSVLGIVFFIVCIVCVIRNYIKFKKLKNSIKNPITEK